MSSRWGESSPVRREFLLLVVEALHCFGSHSACIAAHFHVVEEGHGTGLALRLALLNVSGFQWHCSKWASQFVLEIFPYTPQLEELACSMDTDLNYCPIYSNSIFKLFIMLPFIIFCIQEKRKVNKPRVSGRVELQNFTGTSLPCFPPGLSSGPAWGLTARPVP